MKKTLSLYLQFTMARLLNKEFIEEQQILDVVMLFTHLNCHPVMDFPINLCMLAKITRNKKLQEIIMYIVNMQTQHNQKQLEDIQNLQLIHNRNNTLLEAKIIQFLNEERLKIEQAIKLTNTHKQITTKTSS